MKLIFYFFLITIFFSACKKHITEEVFVFDYEDISIPGVDSIHSISFPTSTIGFAVTNNGLYKTIDSGKTWDLNLDLNKGNVHFKNDLLGVVSPRHYTEDGGDTWVDLGSGFNGLAITETNDLVAMKKESYTTLSFWKKEEGDLNFNIYSYYYITGFQSPKKFKCYGEYLYMFPKDHENDIFAIHLNEPTTYFSIIDGANHSTDLIPTPDRLYLSGTNGEISYGSIPDDQFAYVDRQYYVHTYNYYAIDYYGDHIVAVGQNSIVTNKQTENESTMFKEVYQNSQNGFTDTFYLIDMINDNNVVIVANGAKILIGTI